MSISFSCESCGKKLKAPDSAAGKTSKCPQCGQPVTCPEPVYDAEPVGDMPEILDEVDPYGDLDDGNPYAVAGPPPEAETGEGRRPCPMCGEMIVVGAAKCRFCGEVFDQTLKQAAKKKKKKKRGSADDEEMTTGDWVVALLCSGIGCIAGIVWMIQGKPKGTKMFFVSLGAVVFWNIVSFALQSAQRGGP